MSSLLQDLPLQNQSQILPALASSSLQSERLPNAVSILGSSEGLSLARILKPSPPLQILFLIPKSSPKIQRQRSARELFLLAMFLFLCLPHLPQLQKMPKQRTKQHGKKRRGSSWNAERKRLLGKLHALKRDWPRRKSMQEKRRLITRV